MEATIAERAVALVVALKLGRAEDVTAVAPLTGAWRPISRGQGRGTATLL